MNWEAFAMAVWQAIAPLLATAALAVVLAISGYLLRLVRLKLAALKNEQLKVLLETLVEAAEQMWESGQGNEKRLWVINEFVKRTGMNIDEALLESLVYKLNSQK